MLDAALVATSHRDDRAIRSSNYRHRRLIDDPLTLVTFFLGGEPFAPGAVAFGQAEGDLNLVVPGQPLNRDLLFDALLELAEWFVPRFELPNGELEEFMRGKRSFIRATSIPQVIVPNEGQVKALRRIGRRLAYLPVEATEGGPPPAPRELVRLGRHLLFLTDRYLFTPGQQLLIDLRSLSAASWATAQNMTERASLAALDAWIDPSSVGGYVASKAAEQIQLGPLPDSSWERKTLSPAMDRLNDAMDAGDSSSANSIVESIHRLYRSIVEPAWNTTWRCWERERSWPEEPRFVTRRFDSDREDFARHMSWMNGPAEGRRRTRSSVVQAIRRVTAAEEAAGLLEAEEVIGDPLKMIPLLLDHAAIEGDVVGADWDHKEVKVGNKIASAVPLLTLRTSFPSLMPRGKELWWTSAPDKVRVEVDAVLGDAGATGSLVHLKMMEGVKHARFDIEVGDTVCFASVTTRTHWSAGLPTTIPFTHLPPEVDPSENHIEPEAD